MTATEVAAQQLAQAVARLRLAERDAGQAVTRIDRAYAQLRARHHIQP